MPAKFTVDTSEASAMTGFLKEISVKIGTPQHIGPILKYTHAKLSDAFSEHMATVAPANPERFHHVYEWGENAVGNIDDQLWEDILVGNGNTRTASFVWKASKKAVPVRADFQEVGVKQVHIFTWKAPVMEYETNITINPEEGRGLAFFSGPTQPVNKWPLAYTKKPITVQNPGGEQVKGSFTREYVAWWAGVGASSTFDRTIRNLLERDLADMPLNSVSGAFRSGTRSRSKTIGLQVMANAARAEAAGRDAARAWLAKRDRKYIEGARARRALILGE